MSEVILPDGMIGKYRVIRELGRGATSAVYRADDSFNKRRVAIKVMYPDVLKDHEDAVQYRIMFLSEASLAGKMIHPHIVSIYDAVVDGAMSYLVMEYVEGGTLEKHCKPDNLLDVKDVVEIVFKCVRALAFANMEGLIHRDIKPGNILLRGATDVKVADFGASIRTSSNQQNISAVGSPLYMAPELLAGEKASMQSDLYALGVVMYSLLTGHAPFEAGSRASLEYQIAHHEPKPIGEFRADLSIALIEIVNKAMAKSTEHRFATWEKFGQALAAWSEDQVPPQTEEADISEPELFHQLQALTFFQSFAENELWEVLQLCHARSFPAGTVLIKEGDKGDSFFILIKGSVKVMRGKRLLNVLGTGDCFGEMAYLAKRTSPRSATITAASDCKVVKIRAAELNAASINCRLLIDQKFLSTLIERLETANQLLAVT